MKQSHEIELLQSIVRFVQYKLGGTPNNNTHIPKVVPNYKVKQLKLCTCKADRFTPYTMKIFNKNTIECKMPLFECNNVHSGNGSHICIDY